MPLEVSIVTLNYNYPEVIAKLLKSLPMTTGASYEFVVVDNGSEQSVKDYLTGFRESGVIDTLVLEPVNTWFSEGNNIGVRHSNPESKYILLLNSDTEIVHPLWLRKMIEWMEGVPKIQPYTWSNKAIQPSPGPRGIVSMGWSYDKDIPSHSRPEGWCVMFRRELWQDMSLDFPFYHGFEEMMAKVMRTGAKAGCLCQYSKYITHYEGGSRAVLRKEQIHNKRAPDMAGWFKGLQPEALDFTLGPHEHRSYIEW